MPIASLLLSLVMAAVPAAGLTLPQSSPAQAFQEVVYMEVRPSKLESAFQQLRNWLHRQRQSRADLNLVLLRELDRPNQFLLLAASSQGLPVSIADLSRFKQSSLADDQIMPDFNLDSTFMIGTENLAIPLGAFAMVAHLDADPVQREQTMTQLRRLGNLIPELSGNQGVQILTWKKRPNHWTMVTLWKDINSYLAALEDPRIMGIRAVIASHAAAPADLRLYRRVD